jgi:hypothetical protein
MLPIVSLTIISLLSGIALLWVFSRSVDPEAVNAAKKRVWAHLLEIRLYTDEPLLIWRAHRDLVAANFRYLGLMLRPVLITAIPMLLLLANLESFYGRSSLVPGQEAVVTMQLKGPLDPAAAAPSLSGSPEVTVETPAVREPSTGQVSWRIRATREGSGKLEMAFPDGAVSKSVEVGGGLHYLAQRRVSSMLEYLWNPGERFLSSSTVDWIEIRYPSSLVRGFGIELHWLWWFTLISMISMLALKRRFNAVF